MSDRVNIKADETTRDELKAHKRDGETWDGVLRRAVDALERDAERDQYPGAPQCTDCGAIAHVWTVEGGQLVCGTCADGDVEDPDAMADGGQDELNVERIPVSGICGSVGDYGGALPGLSEQFRIKTGCRADAEYQVFPDAEPPEDATIVSVCEDHIDAAKQFFDDGERVE